MKFASGARAWGRCQRCGDRYYLNQLRPDGYKPELLVGPCCYDIYPPQLKPIDLSDAETLRRPSPDTDDDSAGAGSTLAVALATTGIFPFGGGT
jgi:hypothetical protein